MLNPDRLKPFLLHEDDFVRTSVAEYFGDGWSRDPDLVPLVLEACHRYGTETNRRALFVCPRFPLDEASLDGVLSLLARTQDPRAVEQLGDAVAHAPVGLLAARGAALLDAPYLEPRFAYRVRRRCDLATWTAERLWEGLRDFAHRGDEQIDDTGDIDFDHGDDLVEALARVHYPDIGSHVRLLRLLGSSEGWLGYFLVGLAGARRLGEAIPALLDLLASDFDILLDCSQEAIARIGDPEASRSIRAAFASAPERFRSYTSDLLGDIKHPESEEAILALLETEADPEIRTSLCFGLCRLFSERGIEVVLREIASGYEGWVVNLEEELLPVADVLGVPLPDAARWRAEREELYREQERRASAWDAVDEPEAAGEPGFVAMQPIRRTEPKVGRNDPCPCGSGKKFKKCCGRASG